MKPCPLLLGYVLRFFPALLPYPHNISKYTFPDLCDYKEPFGLIKECVDQNRLGVKNGAGFYDYSNGRDEEVIRYRDKMFTLLAKTLFEQDK